MSCKEQQEEELEVLRSIYEGDSSFKQTNPTSFQYKYGEDGDCKSFIMEISWTETYPEESPVVNMDLFYNKHIMESVKCTISQKVIEQTADLLSTPMTFSLFEWVKDNLETLIADQPDSPPLSQSDSKSDFGQEEDNSQDAGKKKERKEYLTKAQKRRMFDKFGVGTDRPRGWDWVDVVKHLSQTGSQKKESTNS